VNDCFEPRVSDAAKWMNGPFTLKLYFRQAGCFASLDRFCYSCRYQMKDDHMISTTHVQLMASYNRWQNGSIYEAADALDEKQRNEDRGAFLDRCIRRLRIFIGQTVFG
jgi:hypothetical protein